MASPTLAAPAPEKVAVAESSSTSVTVAEPIQPVAPVNAVTAVAAPTPEKSVVPFLDPAFAMAVCRYDLAGGPLKFTVPVSSAYTSVSFYTRGDVAYIGQPDDDLADPSSLAAAATLAGFAVPLPGSRWEKRPSTCAPCSIVSAS